MQTIKSIRARIYLLFEILSIIRVFKWRSTAPKTLFVYVSHSQYKIVPSQENPCRYSLMYDLVFRKGFGFLNVLGPDSVETYSEQTRSSPALLLSQFRSIWSWCSTTENRSCRHHRHHIFLMVLGFRCIQLNV